MSDGRRGPLAEIVDRARGAVDEVVMGCATRSLVRGGAGIAGAVVLLVAGWWLLRPPDTPVEAALPRAAVTTMAGASTVPGGPAAGKDLVVQAAGAVTRPGVYRLPDGSRVADLVELAGAEPDADVHALALAARLADGQRVWVPRVGEPVVSPAGEPTVPSGPVDVNAAEAAELDDLPGIGPTLAAAIVRHREQHGPFRTIDALLDVPGIGPAKLDVLRPLVRV